MWLSIGSRMRPAGGRRPGSRVALSSAGRRGAGSGGRVPRLVRRPPGSESGSSGWLWFQATCRSAGFPAGGQRVVPGQGAGGGGPAALSTRVSLFPRGTPGDEGEQRAPRTSGVCSEVVELQVAGQGHVLPRQTHVAELQVVGVAARGADRAWEAPWPAGRPPLWGRCRTRSPRGTSVPPVPPAQGVT